MASIPRKDVDDVVKEAAHVANRTGRTQYVGAIGFDGVSDLGFTDDGELLASLGTVFAEVKPKQDALPDYE